MKRYFFLMLLASVFALLAFSSCSKNDSDSDAAVLIGTKWYCSWGDDKLMTIEFLDNGKLLTYWSNVNKTPSGGQKEGSYSVTGKNISFPVCFLKYSLATYTFKSAVLISSTTMEVVCEDKLSESSEPNTRKRIFSK